MILKCLGSSSSGNCYIVENDTECLILEAGIKFSEVKKALDFNIGKIVGVVSTHLHKDHFGYAEDYLKAGIPVYASEKTHRSLSKEYDNQIIVIVGAFYVIGGFTIHPFHCEHDVECFGFLIEHDEIGKLLFITDTAFVKYNFKKQSINHILIEANYSAKIVNGYLEKGTIDQARVDRVFRTHMEIETTKEFIRTNRTTNLDSVVLLHLSDGNSNAVEFQQTIQEVVGDGVRVVVADKGLEIPINLFPF